MDHGLIKREEDYEVIHLLLLVLIEMRAFCTYLTRRENLLFVEIINLCHLAISLLPTAV